MKQYDMEIIGERIIIALMLVEQENYRAKHKFGEQKY